MVYFIECKVLLVVLSLHLGDQAMGPEPNVLGTV